MAAIDLVADEEEGEDHLVAISEVMVVQAVEVVVVFDLVEEAVIDLVVVDVAAVEDQGEDHLVVVISAVVVVQAEVLTEAAMVAETVLEEVHHAERVAVDSAGRVAVDSVEMGVGEVTDFDRDLQPEVVVDFKL